MAEDIGMRSELLLCYAILPPTNALPQGFSGGPLSVKVGDALVHAGVNIRPVYGGTEFGPTTPLIGQKEGNAEDWSWMQFSDRVKVRWVPQRVDILNVSTWWVSPSRVVCRRATHGLRLTMGRAPRHTNLALKICRIAGICNKRYMGASSESRGSLEDVCQSQPIVYSWLIELLHSIGRADDVVILASGENVVPATHGEHYHFVPSDRRYSYLRSRRNQVGVLLELRLGRSQ